MPPDRGGQTVTPFQSGFLGGFIVGGMVLFVITSMIWIRILDNRGAF